MSLLTEKLPTELIICGEKCPINTDFRVWIKFTQILKGKEDLYEKTLQVFSLIFPEKLPKNMGEALKEIMAFYSPVSLKGTKGKKTQGRSIYDYDYDGEMIAAAFMQQYGINLSECDMHWHMFRAYFDNLSDETRFVKVLGYRSVKLSSIKDKQMKKHYAEMKALYKLPDNRTESQKEEALNNSFADMFI